MNNIEQAYNYGFKQACAERGVDSDALLDVLTKSGAVPVPVGNIPGQAVAQRFTRAQPQEAAQNSMGLPTDVQQPITPFNYMRTLVQNRPGNVGQGPFGIVAGGNVNPEDTVNDKNPANKPSTPGTNVTATT